MLSDHSKMRSASDQIKSFSWLILPAVIILIVGIVIFLLVLNQPKPQKRGGPPSQGILVDTLLVEPKSFQPKILSYGLVEPRTRSRLVAQVSGRVDYMSERFRDGGFFQKDDTLLKIDATDYEIALSVAEANLAEAEKSLAEEIAEAEQAKANWALLERSSAASSLTLREPQLKAARAMVKSQQALLKQAQVNLERTAIRAPFDGRVLATDVDLGQVVSNNSILGEVYATDIVEIRLPIKNSELSMLELPETYSHESENSDNGNGLALQQNYPSVEVLSELSGQDIWQGEIIRTAGSIDDSSRQLYVFAQITDPFGEKAKGRFPLKIGQYVTAEIGGRMLKSVITVPNKAIYQGTHVYVYQDQAVFRRPIDIAWQNSEYAIIKNGLTEGEEVVISPLGQVASGTAARTADSSPPNKRIKLADSDQDLANWLSKLPAEKIKKLKERARKEGKTVEQVARIHRSQKAK